MNPNASVPKVDLIQMKECYKTVKLLLIIKLLMEIMPNFISRDRLLKLMKTLKNLKEEKPIKFSWQTIFIELVHRLDQQGFKLIWMELILNTMI